MVSRAELNIAQLRDDIKPIPNQLPIEILNDLEECFNHYDEERNGWIPDHLFKNILQNFGFHKMGPRDIETELSKSDPKIADRNAMDLKFCKHVVNWHWYKGLKEAGKDAEAQECFNLFDKKGKNTISIADIKPVLQDFLPFPPTDQDVQEFMNECDKNGTGQITLNDFKQIYLYNDN